MDQPCALRKMTVLHVAMAYVTCLIAGLPTASAQNAEQILEATGIKGGLIVHVGCGDGKLTAALHATNSFLVHGLDRDAKNIEKARSHIRSLGLYGKVSVEQWDADTLPYADNLINLLVSDDLGQIPMAEVMRVLAPHGVAYIKKDGKWTNSVKPRPSEIDEWTHYLHDASNNAVAHDSVIGPPRGLQWIGSPKWSRHHDRMASMSALVSASGRVFYIIDEGPTSSILLPSQWKLVARDAFNGTILWKRKIPTWQTQLWPFKSGPAQLPRRLVAAGDVVYATLGLDAPLVALDAATGKTLRTYADSMTTEEVIYSDGVLILLVNDSPSKPKPYKPKLRGAGATQRRAAKEWPWDEKPRWLMAVQAETGQILWKERRTVVPLSLAADDKNVFFHDGKEVVCLARESGEERWSSSPVERRSSIPTAFAPTLVVYENVVLFSGGRMATTALSAKTGQILWSANRPQSGHASPEDLLVVDGLVWAGATALGRNTGVFTGRDPQTGEAKREFPPDVETYWFHHRCYRSKATDKYLLASRTGIEFVDVRSKHWSINHWVRGGCIYGIMPSNGMLYTPPHACACYMEAKLSGLNALAPTSQIASVAEPVPDHARLKRGPAYSEVQKLSTDTEGSEDWPSYRHDAARSGFIKTTVPAELKQVWQTDLGEKLSSLVIVNKKVFVASVDAHTVHALDADSGTVLWSYTAGGRVDSPPTINHGRVIFGSADGWVYCLRASDGKQVWRFLAAPADRRLTSFGQLESVWPVHGSVLIHDNIVYFVAGRSMFLDGGMRLYRLDAKTGSMLSETILDEHDPKTGKNLQEKVRVENMPVALPDILSCDGKYVYMRSQRMDLEGRREEATPPPTHPAKLAMQQAGEDVHLFSPGGFLDGSGFHRLYWLYGKSYSSGWAWWFRAGKFAPAGRILVLDDSHVYGYGRKASYYRWSTPLEYHLFAIGKKIQPIPKPSKKQSISKVKVFGSNSLNPANKPLTVEAWVWAEKKNGAIVAHGGESQGYTLYVEGGRPRFAIRVNNKISLVSADNGMMDKWTHVAGVLTDDNKLKLYVNGKLSAVREGPGYIAAGPNQNMEIGADEASPVGNYDSPFAFTGVIDEVRIYHRALTAEEIEKHHSAPDEAKINADGLVLSYAFDEILPTGSLDPDVLKDGSGNRNDGIAQGTRSVKGKVGRSRTFTGKTKKVNRPEMVQYLWSHTIPFHVRAMVLAEKTFFVAGPPDLVDEEEAFDHFGDEEIRAKLQQQSLAFAGQRGALLWAVSATDGKKLAEYKLPSPPVWDGMAAARGRLYFSTMEGKVVCMGSK